MIAVRPLVENDREDWLVLWNGYLAFYGTSLSRETTDTTWQRLFDPSEEMYGLCAAGADGETVGIVHYLFHRVTWSTAWRCYLEDLYVDPASRGSGAGRALIEAVYAAADAREADQVYWLTQESNLTARQLYDRIARKTPFIKYQR